MAFGEGAERKAGYWASALRFSFPKIMGQLSLPWKARLRSASLLHSWYTATFTMFSTAKRRCVSAVSNLQCSEVIIPSFLLPAFQPAPQRSAAFSTSSSCRSKIGRAPLSIPPDVNFRILEPPPVKAGSRVGRTQPGPTVEVEGPKGRMSMSIPAYINIQQDEGKRAYTLSILDEKERKQREMWGQCFNGFLGGSGMLTATRHRPRIPSKSHHRSQ